MMTGLYTKCTCVPTAHLLLTRDQKLQSLHFCVHVCVLQFQSSRAAGLGGSHYDL